MKTVSYEILLQNIIFAHHWTKEIQIILTSLHWTSYAKRSSHYLKKIEGLIKGRNQKMSFFIWFGVNLGQIRNLHRIQNEGQVVCQNYVLEQYFNAKQFSSLIFHFGSQWRSAECTIKKVPKNADGLFLLSSLSRVSVLCCNSWVTSDPILQHAAAAKRLNRRVARIIVY